MGRARSILLLTGVIVAWIGVLVLAIVPHPHEGRVVLTLSETHGIHSSDVLAAAAAALWTSVALNLRSPSALRSGS